MVWDLRQDPGPSNITIVEIGRSSSVLPRGRGKTPRMLHYDMPMRSAMERSQPSNRDSRSTAKIKWVISVTPNADKKAGPYEISKPDCIKFEIWKSRFSRISRVFGIFPKTHMRCDILPNGGPNGDFRGDWMEFHI